MKTTTSWSSWVTGLTFVAILGIAAAGCTANQETGSNAAQQQASLPSAATDCQSSPKCSPDQLATGAVPTW